MVSSVVTTDSAKLTPDSQPVENRLGQQETDDIWQATQALLKKRMSQPSFETWIGPLLLDSVSDKSVTLTAERSLEPPGRGGCIGSRGGSSTG
jgi:hypothetical protein